MNSIIASNNAQIIKIVGEIKLLTDNEVSNLNVGDKIIAGDDLIITKNSEITIKYSDGTSGILNGENGVPFANLDILNDDLLTPNSEEENLENLFSEDDIDEISAIQSLIESGDDIDLPATAASGNTPSNGGFSFTSVNRENSATIATSRFDTSTFSQDAINAVEVTTVNDPIIIQSSLSTTFDIDGPNQTANISGETTGVNANQTLSITFTDNNGNQVTFNNITVDLDGSFSSTGFDISSLEEGQITASTTVTDLNNQTISDLGNDLLDSTPTSAPTVQINDGGNNDGFINASEQATDIEATISILNTGITVGDTIEVVINIAGVSTTTNIIATQEIIDNELVRINIQSDTLIDSSIL
ncbi:MAG: retention module-containing protein, partial [Flavobacteriales bacterium]